MENTNMSFAFEFLNRDISNEHYADPLNAADMGDFLTSLNLTYRHIQKNANYWYQHIQENKSFLDNYINKELYSEFEKILKNVESKRKDGDDYIEVLDLYVGAIRYNSPLYIKLIGMSIAASILILAIAISSNGGRFKIIYSNINVEAEINPAVVYSDADLGNIASALNAEKNKVEAKINRDNKKTKKKKK